MWPRKVYKFVASHSKKGGTAALIPAYRAMLDDIFSSHGPFVIEEISRKEKESVRMVPIPRAPNHHPLIICVILESSFGMKRCWSPLPLVLSEHPFLWCT
jgi:hypothetical protein